MAIMNAFDTFNILEVLKSEEEKGLRLGTRCRALILALKFLTTSKTGVGKAEVIDVLSEILDLVSIISGMEKEIEKEGKYTDLVKKIADRIKELKETEENMTEEDLKFILYVAWAVERLEEKLSGATTDITQEIYGLEGR
ncbi:MAG: hypothetical protein ACYDBP_07250 [Leptospirales bacterium]